MAAAKTNVPITHELNSHIAQILLSQDIYAEFVVVNYLAFHIPRPLADKT